MTVDQLAVVVGAVVIVLGLVLDWRRSKDALIDTRVQVAERVVDMLSKENERLQAEIDELRDDE